MENSTDDIKKMLF